MYVYIHMCIHTCVGHIVGNSMPSALMGSSCRALRFRVEYLGRPTSSALMESGLLSSNMFGTVDDINPGVPLKGSIRVALRGSFKGSIGFWAVLDLTRTIPTATEQIP